MVRIRLAKGMSYKDKNIHVTKQKPEVEVNDMELALYYESTGFFEILPASGSSEPEYSIEPPEELWDSTEYSDIPDSADVFSAELSEKTVAELKEYAKARGIDITGLAKKSELIEHIINEQKKADEVRALLRGM